MHITEPIVKSVTTSIIVAMTTEGVIGKDNVMPWRISEEMAYFRRKTVGYPVIMGRKTHESIGRILPKRQNLVITRNPKAKDHSKPTQGLIFVNGLADAINWCDGVSNECFIIGGSEIYKQALDNDIVDKMYINVIAYPYQGNVYFPVFDKNDWFVEFPKEQYTEFKPMVLTKKKIIYK